MFINTETHFIELFDTIDNFHIIEESQLRELQGIKIDVTEVLS